MVKIGNYNIIVENNRNKILCKETKQNIGTVQGHARKVKGTHRSPFRDKDGYYTYHHYYTLDNGKEEYPTRKAAITEAARRAGLIK